MKCAADLDIKCHLAAVNIALLEVILQLCHWTLQYCGTCQFILPHTRHHHMLSWSNSLSKIIYQRQYSEAHAVHMHIMFFTINWSY